ncbi:cytochrome P450 [Microbispora hainanensis]|uniref:cytochrome P450 n=1 Tax=Microbispora TaxID=2005 RepID=UPI001159E610|nr:MULTISPECIES: cytochrome P450 [Microbispora]NJP29956.1 cytochrome P450 [Microbispora sp. CL1-1]TQS03504.1 cytochrome P450 [Microbispora sp. SCL1-1]
MTTTAGGLGRASDWDPTAPETFDSSHEVYAGLRRRCPVPWSDAFGGFWAATRYEDVVRVARDSETFSTAVQNVVPHVPRTQRRPPLHFDPPEHGIYRAPMDRVLRRSVVRRLEPAFAEAARELLGPLLARGGGDYSREFALPYAAQCFAIFLGLPVERVLEIRRIGVAYSFAIQEMDRAGVMAASEELYAIARAIVEDRRADPRDPDEDLVSSLLRASADQERPIPYDMVVATVRQTIVAGIGAPHAALGSAAVHLSRDPGLQDRLRADPGLLPAAVEELLRLYAPYRVFARTATRDVELGGRTVRAGEAIAMIFPSANRDEAVFDEADRLDLERRPNRHLAFGRGAHRCPGAAMARLEMTAALGELLAGTSRVEPDGEVEMFNWLEFGPRSAPLRLVPR